VDKVSRISDRLPRRRRAAEPPPTREVILDTAERLFAERGVDGVAVRDLAREMNLTAPSLYNHFRSKQELYDAVLERGLLPLLEMSAEAWGPGDVQVEKVRAVADQLVGHLAHHPHLAALLQRALLEDAKGIEALVERWLSPMYRGGVLAIKDTAKQAGWEIEELPHLAVGLFGMVFAYFTNLKVLRRISKRASNPLAPETLEHQRAFLEKAIYRLLGPQPRAGAPSSAKETV
jgi:AcrR family transcriptional regulator